MTTPARNETAQHDASATALTIPPSPARETRLPPGKNRICSSLD